MNAIEDVMGELEYCAARDLAAAAFLRRLGGFLDSEEARGFDVGAEVEVVGSGVLRVALAVRAPAGEVGAPEAVELVEGAAPKLPAYPVPEADGYRPDPRQAMPLENAAPATDASKPADAAPAAAKAAETKAAPKSVPPRWTEDEDATAVRMAVAGSTAREIAAELGRPVPGTGYRLAKVLKDRIAAGRAAGMAGDAPEPEVPDFLKPEPVAAPVAPLAPQPAPTPVDPRGASGNFKTSPILGCDPDRVGEGLMMAHLRWLYGAVCDEDVVSCDLDLVERLARGDGAGAVAEAFEWDKADVIARFVKLRGGLTCTLHLQKVLLVALRALLREVSA